MKLSFPDRFSVGVLTRQQVESSISWLVVIGFLVGVGGSYLLGNHVISLAIIVLGIGGILVGVAILTLLNWSKIGRRHIVSLKKKLPRITSEWRYRPKETFRTRIAASKPNAETSDLLSPNPFVAKRNNSAWSNDDSLPSHPLVTFKRSYGAHHETALANP